VFFCGIIWGPRARGNRHYLCVASVRAAGREHSIWAIPNNLFLYFQSISISTYIFKRRAHISGPVYKKPRGAEF